jgi:hypothetical protein
MKSYLLKLFGREEGPYAEPQIAQMFADYFMSFARRQWWVANGCALWLNTLKTTRLWSPPT